MNEKQENYEVVESMPVAKSQVNPYSLLEMAIANNADLDKLEKLMELQERQEKKEAKRAYVKAMAGFKKNPPVIIKDNTVEYKQVKYDHATLGNITEVINSALSNFDLTASWSNDQSDKGITVTCSITHIQGHSESTKLTAQADGSGSKNAIQAIGSTITYLQRYTLLSLLGLAAQGQDDDGKTSGEKLEPISDKQLITLNDIISGIKGGEKRFLKYFKIETIAGLPASEYNKAMQTLKENQK